MIRVDPFDPDDLLSIDVQPAQRAVTTDWHSLGQSHAASGTALTARREDGRILLCGGAIQIHRGYATLWSVLAHDAGPAMLGLTRRVRWFLATLPYARIDAVASATHREGCAWLELMGFAREAEIGAAFEGGGDGVIYRWRK
jgi:hypothetical protein